MFGEALWKAERFIFGSASGWIGSEGKFQKDTYHRSEELPIPTVGLHTSVSASSIKILVFGWLFACILEASVIALTIRRITNKSCAMQELDCRDKAAGSYTYLVGGMREGKCWKKRSNNYTNQLCYTVKSVKW